MNDPVCYACGIFFDFIKKNDSFFELKAQKPYIV